MCFDKSEIKRMVAVFGIDILDASECTCVVAVCGNAILGMPVFRSAVVAAWGNAIFDMSGLHERLLLFEDTLFNASGWATLLLLLKCDVQHVWSCSMLSKLGLWTRLPFL